jgi:hypothetical protein
MLEYLRNTSGCKIILLHAPAGKTTLLAHCRQSPRHANRGLCLFTDFAVKRVPMSGLELLTSLITS